jgi:hypothetical protein
MENRPQEGAWSRRAGGRLALVAAGIIAGQLVLYGSALVGSKVLLPLACLAEPGKYIPQRAGEPAIKSRQPVLLDLVVQLEPDRRFAARELAARRFPHWTPYKFGGVPFMWPKYSPFLLLSAASESPLLIPWAHLLAALVAGFGAFAFCRTVLKLSYWPSTFAAWCYPITGWFILYQGYATPVSVVWLPWLCCAIDATIRQVAYAAPALAVTTALAVVSGNLDVAGQVLLVSASFGLWRLWNIHGRRRTWRTLGKRGLTLALAGTLGLLLASPYLLPALEYGGSSARLGSRSAGKEERPPVGPVALPQLVLPDMYGTYGEIGTAPLMVPVESNQIEGPAAGYTGLLATLLLAPWAFSVRRRRPEVIFLLALAGVGVAWVLNVPGIVHVLRLPGLNLMSHNRLVFAASFAVLALAAIGLQGMLESRVAHRRSFVPQVALLVILLGWCLYRAMVFPEPLASEYARRIAVGAPDLWVGNQAILSEAQAWFARGYWRAALLCMAGLVLLLALRRWPRINCQILPVVGGLLVVDLLAFGHSKRIPQDPSLYYPEVPALRAVASATPGRALGIGCLPANLAQMAGLQDVRGYDSFDPGRWVELLSIASAQASNGPAYAATQRFSPKYSFVPPAGIRFPPVLDMLGIRYAIFRGLPSSGMEPRFRSDDYWILENAAAQPRAFVPRSVATFPEQDVRQRLSLPDFDPREVAYVESPVALPARIRGAAAIKGEIPSRILIEAHMETPGLVVLADNWHPGWRAYVNGERTPILRTNYAVRGIVVPAGSSEVELRYESAAVRLGSALALAALALLTGWTASTWRRSRPAVPACPATAS